MAVAPASPELRLVLGCYDAWSARDLPGLLAALSDDCTYHMHVPVEVLEVAGRHEGKPAIAACLARIVQEFDFLVYAVDWISAAGATVRARVVYYYRHPDTGDRLDGAFRHVWRVMDGKIVQVDEFHDVARLKAFLDMVRGMGKT